MHNIKPILLGICSLLPIQIAAGQYVGPHQGQRVAFLGDSITQNGANWQTGYVRLLETGLAEEGHEIEVIPAGVSGNTSKDMLARLGEVLDKLPDWLLVSCGVNDVWHGADGVALDQYKTNIRSIVDRATAAGIKVVILAATPIDLLKGADANNTQLVTYNEFLRDLAAQNKILFIDLNAAMREASANLKRQYAQEPGDLVTFDGVHPNALGNLAMATGILRAWGFSKTQMDAFNKTVEQIPGALVWADMHLDIHQGLSVHDYFILANYAEQQNKSIKRDSQPRVSSGREEDC